MTKTSVSRQFKKEYPEYKEYADFMDILDPSEKTLINQSKYVLKPFDAIFYGKVFPGNIFTDPNFEISEHVTYFQQLFNAFLEWAEKDFFLRENGNGEYDYEEIDRWDGLFEKLNKLPTEGTRIVFSIVEDVERKERDNYIKQIKGELADKETLIEKFDLLYKLKMSKRFNHHDILIEWIDDMLDLIKNDRYEDATTDIKGHLDLTEIQLLLHFLSHEGLFPKLYNISERKGQAFLSQLFNKPPSSFKKPQQKAQEITQNRIGPEQIDYRLGNLKKINQMLSGIADVDGINNVIKSIDLKINELKRNKNK